MHLWINNGMLSVLLGLGALHEVRVWTLEHQHIFPQKILYITIYISATSVP